MLSRKPPRSSQPARGTSPTSCTAASRKPTSICCSYGGSGSKITPSASVARRNTRSGSACCTTSMTRFRPWSITQKSLRPAGKTPKAGRGSKLPFAKRRGIRGTRARVPMHLDGSAKEICMNWLKQWTQRNSTQSPPARPGDPKRSPPATMPPRRTWLTFLIVIAINYLLMRILFPGPDAPSTVPYTFFKEQVAKANVESIYGRGEIIEVRFVTPVTYPPADEQNAKSSGQQPPADKDRGAPFRGEPKTVHHFTTTLPSFVDPGLEKFLIDHKVEISAKPI